MTPRRIGNRFLGILAAAALVLMLVSIVASVHA